MRKPWPMSAPLSASTWSRSDQTRLSPKRYRAQARGPSAAALQDKGNPAPTPRGRGISAPRALLGLQDHPISLPLPPHHPQPQMLLERLIPRRGVEQREALVDAEGGEAAFGG